jgi:DHA1 family tetracycline resistance protein-like MFS transporter
MMANSESTTHVAAPAAEVPGSSNRSALLIVFLVVFIDLLGFGIVLPMLPVIANTYVAGFLGENGDPKVAGLVIGLLMASFSLMQFLFAPGWGRLSDRVGRRPILLLGLVGSVVFYTLFGFAASFPASGASVALTLLFVARSGAGIAGATIATAQAVIADSTPPEKRKHGMALIGAAFGIGFTFGPLIAFASLTFFPSHLESIGYTAALLSLVALGMGLKLLPETRRFGIAPSQRRKIIDFSAVKKALASASIAPVVWTFFLASFGFGAFETTLALLLQEVFGFGIRPSFLVFAYIGFVLMLTQGVFYRRLAKRLSEVTFMTLGILFMAAGVGGLGAVTVIGVQARQNGEGKSGQQAGNDGRAEPDSANDLQQPPSRALLAGLTLALTLSVIGFAFVTPSAQALVSRRTDADQQGEILGVNQSASAMARILGPILGVTLYKSTETHLLPYAFGAVLLLIMLPMMPRIRRG